jgi:hypothetical protein
VNMTPDTKKQMEVNNVRNIRGETSRVINKNVDMGYLEIRLLFPDCEATKTLRHNNIHTVLRYDNIRLRGLEDSTTDKNASYERLRFVLDNQDVVMNLVIVYGDYANVIVKSGVVVSVSDY